MIHIYRLGGDWVSDGIEYTVDITGYRKLKQKLADGWFLSFEEMKASIPEDGNKYEEGLREKIKALNGKPADRSSIETLEKQLKELEDGSDN